MDTPLTDPYSSLQAPLPRHHYLDAVQLGLDRGELRFARECVLAWLSAFPGDLQAGFLYAKTLLAENKPEHALPVLNGLCAADPEFTGAVQAMYSAEQNISKRKGGSQFQSFLAPVHLLALTGGVETHTTVASWSRQLYTARQALQEHRIEEAEGALYNVLSADPAHPLAAVTHLQMVAAVHAPLAVQRALADHYHRRWPDCLACSLILAVCMIDDGDYAQGVALLHQAAARDVGGQVAGRLWGPDHAFKSLWPDPLALPLPVRVPASVAAALGWNRLTAGQQTVSSEVTESSLPEWLGDLSLPSSSSAVPVPTKKDPTPAQHTGQTQKVHVTHRAVAHSGSNGSAKTTHQGVVKTNGNGTHKEPENPEIAGHTAGEPARHLPEELERVQQDLARLAKRLKRPEATSLDGRFPVYIIFSTRDGLVRRYGKEGASQVETGMAALASAITTHRRGWNGRVFLPDDPETSGQLGIKPARPADPWELKLRIADLEGILAKRGEMIGALLIVGGPEVVPFHRLPNPIDDPDPEVLSDNPYGSRGDNYFLPDWPVGRLVDGAGNPGEPTLLLAQLQRVRQAHSAISRSRVAAFIQNLTTRVLPSRRASLGYSAEIWQDPARKVFKIIQRPGAFWVSPPVVAPNGNGKHGHPRGGNAHRMAYYNLHGLIDAPEWYGHRDPLAGGEGPDYPVALRPADIGRPGEHRLATASQVVFSEACYGAHISGKTSVDSIALRLMESGTQVLIGSTGMSYGSIDLPLITADLLAHSFWTLLQNGLTAGEALRQSKLFLAQEMDRRQGYLDGEDQKTLISFVLYGDPLTQPFPAGTNPRSTWRSLQSVPEVKTVCDRANGNGAVTLAPEVEDAVRQVVAKYLPGMKQADMRVPVEREECKNNSHTCPTHQLQPVTKGKSSQLTRRTVTLRKQVPGDGRVHPTVARLALDNQGRIVKMAVSR